jgi:hypothetical protein
MRLSTLVGSVLCLYPLCAAAWATPTENHQLRVLPAGPVAVDGKIADWDLSGGIFACDDVENLRDSMSVWMHAMHDRDNLYLLARFRDATPLNNPGQTLANYGWSGDSLQFRVVTAPDTPAQRFSHWTCWQGRDGQNVMDVAYGKDFKGGNIKDAKTRGARQALVRDDNGKGYVQEVSIPWKLLTTDGSAPSDPLRFTIEPNFTVGLSGRASLKDIFASNTQVDRVFTFMNYKSWGLATLESKNKVAPAALRLADGRTFPVTMQDGLPVVDWTGLIQNKELPGFKTITFTMPEDGAISLNIFDKNGVVVRQLLSSAFYTKGRHTVKWDGLTTPNAKLPGRPVAAGEYSWKALFHTGIGLKLRGWAANAGRAPWENGPGTNWGGDQGNPRATATDEKNVYLGWSGAEAGKALLACDLNGNVRWKNNRGGISGVRGLAAADGVLYVLGGMVGSNSTGGAFYKLKTSDGSYLSWDGQESADVSVKDLWPAGETAPGKADAIAAANGKIYLAFETANKILIVDGQSGKRLGQFTAQAPKVLVAQDERLYVLGSDGAVQRFDFQPNATAPSAPATLVTGLNNAAALAVAPDGTLYVGVGDPDNQIKVFDAGGKWQRNIGRPGGRQVLGAWQGDGLRFIESISLASDGKLWVAEFDEFPRRVSTWNAQNGQLVKEFFGPASYGAPGGGISPADPNVMVGLGCEWKLDPATGQAACVAVITRDGMANSRFAIGSNGRLYLAVADKWINEPGPVTIFERTGPGEYKTRARFTYDNLPKPKQQEIKATRYWADANGDEREQPDEITVVNENLRFSSWYMAMAPNLTFYTMKDGKQFKVTGFTPAGAPLYDLSNPVVLPKNDAVPDMGGDSTFGSADDKIVVYNPRYNKAHEVMNAYEVNSGRYLWSYPSNFVGVHGSHKATPPETGMIRGAYEIAGTAKLPAPIGNIWAIATNVGEWHLLTEQGFYLAKLFEGDPLKVRWPETATPDAVMNSVPPGAGGEDFGGSIAYGTDNKLYIQAGKTAFWNLEVTGLETVRALAGETIRLSAQDVSQAIALRETLLQQAAGKNSFAAKKMTPKLTGVFGVDFKTANIVAFQKSSDAAVRASAVWDDTALYLGWEVTDATPWQNAAQTPEEMYLMGDTVDFQLATDPNAKANRNEAGMGDFRLSIGNFNGTPTAVIYRKVSAQKKPKIFSSGVVAEYSMDYVSTLPAADIKVRKFAKGYHVEAAIPFAALDWKPTAGETLRGDFGATHGGPDGGRTRLRTHWNNQQTGLVDDAVFELKMEPRNWGEFTFTP